ncbi:MAG: molecular chaperone Tir [Crocinitomicaceae bacterium]|nr:molecular chaperone Tir [Crocinitomicaceae bacterium]|tara:strand:+ start:493 stop:888 length:396 start_codon:yes stop_codon:yes gene_type:complete
MNDHFEKVKSFLLDLEYNISYQDATEEVLVVEDETEGIRNLFVACASPILIMEQFLFELKEDNQEVFKNLLIKNRDIVHGAFALDETGSRVIFRDTLQLENLDQNELEGSINSLSLLLSEYSDELIKFSKY